MAAAVVLGFFDDQYTPANWLAQTVFVATAWSERQYYCLHNDYNDYFNNCNDCGARDLLPEEEEAA